MNLFDRFASWASTRVSRATFFAFCVLIVVVWLPSYAIFGSIDTWQLVINTVTTVLTFLLVALLQNAQERFERATNEKLNAIACYLLGGSRAELGRAVGIEDEISA